jgi:hypothetical protein
MLQAVKSWIKEQERNPRLTFKDIIEIDDDYQLAKGRERNSHILTTVGDYELQYEPDLPYLTEDEKLSETRMIFEFHSDASFTGSDEEEE